MTGTPGALKASGLVRLDTESAAAVAIVSLERGDKHNALTLGMLADLTGIVDEIADDAEVRAVLLRAEGPSFSAGQDLKEPRPASPSPRVAVQRIQRNNIAAALSRIPLPVVVALHGNVIGRGADIAMAADFRIAAPDTVFSYPEVALGMTLGSGGIERLVRVVGESRAMAILTLGDRVPAESALAWGMVHELVDDADARGLELAVRLAALPELAVSGTKNAVRRASDAAADAGARADGLLNVLKRS